MTKDYIVRMTNKKDTYEVHKFDGGDIPEITYVVLKDHHSKWKCNCPSGMYRGYCKHKDMVKKHRKTGKALFDVE